MESVVVIMECRRRRLLEPIDHVALQKNMGGGDRGGPKMLLGF